MFTEDVLKKFWSKVDKTGCKENPLKDKCWMWLGSLNSSGYGSIGVHNKIIGAHRFSWQVHHNKKIPKGYYVLHKCDNPACVNPDHLWIGTQSDNIKDMIQKKRDGYHKRNFEGKGNPNAKLKKSDVVEIRKLYKSGKFTQQELANMFNVTQPNIGYIVRGESWLEESA